jgi:hypothetical protein
MVLGRVIRHTQIIQGADSSVPKPPLDHDAIFGRIQPDSQDRLTEKIASEQASKKGE